MLGPFLPLHDRRLDETANLDSQMRMDTYCLLRTSSGLAPRAWTAILHERTPPGALNLKPGHLLFPWIRLCGLRALEP